MQRVKVNFPDEEPLFRTKILLRISDMNYGNHLGNDRILSIVHEARVQWLAKHKLTELDIGGCGLIMADAMIAFKNEGFYGDELSISLFVDHVTANSFDVLYKITTEREGKTYIIANVKTGMVCFHYSNSKISRIPPSFLSILHT